MRRRKQVNATGCGIACIAMLANKPYELVEEQARLSLGFGTKQMLYTRTGDLRKLGSEYGIHIEAKRIHKFKDWVHLPNQAIVAINYQANDNIWHWVVFRREYCSAFVLDPKRSIKANRRTDFGRMKPFGFLPVAEHNA